MGNSHLYSYYNQIQPLQAQQASKYSQQINCIIEPKNNKGGLYLGNIYAASNVQLLKSLGIAAVLTVAIESRVHYGGIIPYHLIIHAKDIPTYDLKQHVEDAMKFIRMGLKETNVLVHCMMGVSRSASMVIWHLMTREKMALAEAYNLVKQKRPIINPNQGFVEQLKTLEKELVEKKPNKYKGTEENTKQFIESVKANGKTLRYSGVQN